ncbi:hypothetical protein ACFIPR_003211 [Enterobacter kobei]
MTTNRFALAMLISAVISTSATAATTSADIQALQNFDPLAEIQQVQRNRSTDYTCMGTMTIESTGKIRRNQSVRVTAGDLISDNGTERTYHDEDENGSSTMIINTKTGQGTYTIMDQSSVLATGNMKCK